MEKEKQIAAAQSLQVIAEALEFMAEGVRKLNGLLDSSERVQAKPTEPEPAVIPLEEVRGILADRSRAGFTAEVREIIKRHGGERLSDIWPEEYPAVIREAEGLK